jgi:hypothetical protein
MGFFDESGGAPAISFDGAAPGTTITGILAKPHEEGQQTDADTGELLWFDAEQTQPKPQAILTLQTEYRAFEYCSEAYRSRALKDGQEDDGLRRLFIKGSLKTPSLNRAFRDAMREAKHRGEPEVGALISMTFVKKTPIDGSKFKRNDFRATYAAPTPETLAKVRDLEPVAAGMFGGDDTASADDTDPGF